ncbi:MAG: hypothetical protein ACN4EU_14620, partial [Brevundimonas mediterranea]
MSVLLVVNLDLARLAAFAHAFGALPDHVTPDELVQSLRLANLSAWSDRYPNRHPGGATPSIDLDAALEALDRGPDPMAVLRTARELLYNCDLAHDPELTSILSRIIDRAAAERLRRLS